MERLVMRAHKAETTELIAEGYECKS